MEQNKRRREVKLLSADGRRVCSITPPDSPNPPEAIVLGARVFILRGSMGYREVAYHEATAGDVLTDQGAGPQYGPCLAAGCSVFAMAGANFCPGHAGLAVKADEAELAAAAAVDDAADAAGGNFPAADQVESPDPGRGGRGRR